MYFKSSTFLTAVNGTKVFAVLNFILACLSSLATIGGLIFFATRVLMHYYAYNQYKKDMMMMPNIFAAVGTLILMIFSLIALMFSIFLLNGVFKKKPEHVQAYFVYGVAVDVLCSLTTVGYTLLQWEDDFTTSFFLIIVCIIYALILAMIRKTCKEFQSLNQQYNHKQLIEKC